jgi:CrcB protein
VTSVLEWVGIAVLGGLGALARFRLDAAVQGRAAGEFPFGTLAVNLIGAFCLGLLTGLSVTGGAFLLSGTATLGSFTTFSTWMLETERLAEEGEGRLAAVNVAVSLGAGAVAAILGWLLGAAL